MTAQEKWDQYAFLLKYVIVRNTEYHFADEPPWGWMVPLIAALPLFAKRTRPAAILLWVNIIGWIPLIALNSQVRWQNERYTMSAVAWLFVLAAMGLSVLMSSRLLRSGSFARAAPSIAPLA